MADSPQDTRPTRRKFLQVGAAAIPLAGAALATGAAAQETDQRQNPPSREPGEGEENEWSLGAKIGFGLGGTTAAALMADAARVVFSRKDLPGKFAEWEVTVEEALTPQEKQEAYRIRVAGMPNYAFDENHPDNARLGMKIVKKGPDAGMHDRLDENGQAHTFLIKEHGNTIGTFRLVVSPEGRKDGLLSHGLFAPEEVAGIDGSRAVEASFMSVLPGRLLMRNGVTRTALQFPDVLALAVTKKIIEFAHEHGKDTFIAPTPGWKAMPFKSIGLEAPEVPGVKKEKPMGDKVDLVLVEGAIDRLIANAPEPVKKIIDPHNHFHTPQLDVQKGGIRGA